MLEGNYRKKVYSTLKKEAGLTISEEEFNKRLNSDPSYKKKVYSTLNKDMGLTISEDEFNNRLKKKESSEPTSQERPSASPTKTTRPSTSSDTEPPTRAAASVALGGPTKLFGQQEQQRPKSVMYGDGVKQENVLIPSKPIDVDQSIKYLEKKTNKKIGDKFNVEELERDRKELERLRYVKKNTPAKDKTDNIYTLEFDRIRDIDNYRSKAKDELDDELNQVGFLNGLKTGLSSIYNTAIEGVGRLADLSPEEISSIQIEKSPIAKEIIEVKSDPKNSKLTKEEIEFKAYQLAIDNKAKSIRRSETDSYLESIPEDVKNNLRFDKIDNLKTISEDVKKVVKVRDFYLASIENNIEYLDSLRAQNPNSKDIEPLKEKIDSDIDYVKKLDRSIYDVKRKHGDAYEEVDLLSRNYDMLYNMSGRVTQTTLNILSKTSDYISDFILPESPNNPDWINSLRRSKDKAVKETVSDISQLSNTFRKDIEDVNSVNDFINWSSDVMAVQIPILAATSTGTGGIGFLGVSGAAEKSYDMKQEMLSGKAQYSDLQMFAVPLLFGAAEAVSEIPTYGILKKAGLATKAINADDTLRRELVNSTFDSILKNLKGYTKDQFKEGSGELLTNIIQNASDKYILGKEDVGIFDNSVDILKDTFLMTSIIQSSPHIYGAITKPFMSPEYTKLLDSNSKKILELNKLLTDETVSNEVKAIAKNKIESLNTESGAIVNKVFSNIESLNDESRIKIAKIEKTQSELRAKASTIIEDKTIDAATKKELLNDLKSQFKEVENERIDILSGKKTVSNVAPTQVIEQPAQPEVKLEEVIVNQAKPAEDVTLIKSGQKVEDVLNRPATLVEFGGSKLETPLQGEIYQEGQRVIFEDKDNKTYDLGNIDEMSGKSVEDLGIQPQTELVSVTKEGKIQVGNNTWNVQEDLPTRGIEYNNDGSVKAVSLKDDSGKTVMYEGQVAEDIAYQALLKEFQTEEQVQAINELLEKDEELNKQLREAEEAASKTTGEIAKPGPAEVTVEQPTATEQVAKTEIEEALDDIIRPKATDIKDQVDRAKKALSKIMKGVEIILHDTQESYTKATKDTTRGAYINGKIHLNPAKADRTSVAHEVFHAVLLKYIADGKPATILTNKMLKAVARSLKSKPEVMATINEFVKNGYKGQKEVWSEEKLAEVLGYLASEYETLPQPTKNIIQKWLEKIAIMLKMKPFTDKEVVDFMNTLAERVREGQEITEDDVKAISQGASTYIADPTEINRSQKTTEEKVKIGNHKLSFVKESDLIDFDSLLKDISNKKQKVWFWVADQLGRGDYNDAVIGEEHYLDAGPSFALDPVNRKKNVIWATGKNEKEIGKLIKDSDYIFIISGSPLKSKLFNKKVIDIVAKRAGDFNSFKKNILKASKIKPLNELLSSVDSWEQLRNSPKRKEFLLNILSQADKNTPLKKALEKYNSIVDLNELRDGFYADNNFDTNDIMLVLKPTEFGGKSDHSTYENNILGDVVGVPDIKVNAFDILPSDIKDKYKKDLGKSQQQQVVAPYGIGVKPIERRQKDSSIKGSEVWKHIKEITPNKEDIPSGFKKDIISRTFINIDDFDVESLLKTDPDFKDYYDSNENRYDEGDVDPRDISNEIVVVDGVLLDGYSRASTLLKNGESTTNAYVAKPKVSGRRQISPENSSNYANMTEDGKGNFVFFHFGPRGIKFIDPKKYGSNKGAITSKPEVAAMGRVGGMSQFYTMPEYQESNVSGDKYMIKVPMDKVYDFNTDPDNLIGKAKEIFKEKHPDLPFTANDQVAFITKLAEKAGYDMTVAEWNGMSRAQSTKPLKPVDVQVMDGNVISKPFNENYESNASKGFTSVVPTSKEAMLKKVYEDINNERNSQNKYDGLYHLAEEFPKKTQEEITEMIEGSDISQGLKDAYATALAYEPGMRMSARRQVNTGAIAENTKGEIDRVKKLPLEAEDGATFNLDGTKYDKGGLIVPVTSLEPNTNQKELSPEMVAKFTKDNESKIGDDSIVKVGIYKFPDKDTVSVDMSIVIPNKHRAVALEFGKMIGQESLYDLDANENVKTGADGMNPVNLTDEQFRVAAAALKEGQIPQITISRRQQNSAIDRAVAAAKSRGFDDKTIINYLVSRGYTSEEATRAVLKYNKSIAEKTREEEGVFTRAGRRRIAIALDKFRRVTLSKRSFNTKTGLQLREFMEGNINAELREARIALEEYDKMLPKDKTQRAVIEAEADKFLKGDTSANLPLEFKAVVGRFRTHIDNLSMRLIDTGTLTQAQADKLRSNIGQYVNRSYQVFDDPKWKDKVTEEMKEAVRNELRNLYYSLRGNVPKAKKDRKTYGDKFAYRVERAVDKTDFDEDTILNKMIEDEINNMLEPNKAADFVGQRSVASKDLSIMKQKNPEIPLSVRQLMGEYGNAGQNYAKTIQKLSALVYKADFLNKMRDLGLGVFFFEKDDPNRDQKEFNTRIAADSSKTMNPLNGLWTTPELAEMFKEDTVGDIRYIEKYLGKGVGSGIMYVYRTYLKTLGAIKKMKTAYSVGGHVKNVLGNVELVLSNAYINPKEYANAFMTLKNSNKGEFKKKMDEYTRLGILSSNIDSAEIRKLFNSDSFDSFIEARIKKGYANTISKFDEKVSNLYQTEDDFFKILGYEIEMKRYEKAYPNKSKEEIQGIVSNNIKNILPNYNRIGQIGNFARALPLASTFMSYQLESYRTAWNNIALAKQEIASGNSELKSIGIKRIIAALSTQTAKHFIMHSLGTVVFSPILSMMAAAGADDDEEEQGITDYDKKVKYMKLMLPEYAKEDNVVITKEGDGKISFINFSSSDPRKGISNTISAAIQGKDPVDGLTEGLKSIMNPFLNEDILLQAVTNIKRNEKQSGDKIYEEAASDFDKGLAITNEMWKVLQPGTYTSAQKIYKSDDVRNEIVGQFTGYKTHEIDVKKNLYFSIKKLKTMEESAMNVYRDANYQFEEGKIDKSERNRLQSQAKKSAEKTYEEMMGYLKAASYFGAKDYEIDEAFEKNGISSYVIKTLWANEMPVID